MKKKGRNKGIKEKRGKKRKKEEEKEGKIK